MDGATSSSGWIAVGRVGDIPMQGARRVETKNGAIAVFRAISGDVFALEDRCPHRGGPLSEGIVHGNSVSCPLHNWTIDLATGHAVAPDRGCAPVVPVRVEDDVILIYRPAATS